MADTLPPLTEEQIVQCLVEAGCLGTVKMSFDSGPYDITRPSINADRFARAIARTYAAQAVAEAVAQAVERVRGTIIVDGETPERMREAIAQRVADVSKPTGGGNG